jgi:hypothetical protein
MERTESFSVVTYDGTLEHDGPDWKSGSCA